MFHFTFIIALQDNQNLFLTRFFYIFFSIFLLYSILYLIFFSHFYSIFHSFEYRPRFSKLTRLAKSNTNLRWHSKELRLHFHHSGNEDDFKLPRGREVKPEDESNPREEKKAKARRLSHLQVISWFSRLTVAGAILSKQHSRHCLSRSHPSSFPPQKSHRLFLSLLPPLPLPPDSRDDVNARRHNDESRRRPRSRIAGDGVAAAGLCYLPNRMKKRGPSRPLIKEMRGHRKIEVLLLAASLVFPPPSPFPSSCLPLNPPSPSSSSSSSSLASSHPSCLRKAQRRGQKTGLLYGAARNAPNKYRSFTNCPRLIAPPNRPL